MSMSFAQPKKLDGVILANGDTSFWYKYQTQQLKKLSLSSLDTIGCEEYYRVWTNKQVIDIWQNPNGKYGGKLTTWTDEYEPKNKKQENRSFIKYKNLSIDTTELLRTLIQSSNILSIPTDDSIGGWRQGFDGITYIIEKSSKGNYSFKTYWTPKAQDSLEEAIQVQKFIDNIFELASANLAWKEFLKLIPYNCYINGGPMISCSIVAKKSKKRFIKKKNYR